MTKINKLAPLITSQLPSYAYEKYPTFVSFITTYFEWLDEQDNYAYFLNAFKANMDIDQSNDDFVEQFLQEFADGIPTYDLKIDKSELVKYIREFYISKGTEESFKFIFRVLYDEDVNITYPREWMLASSDNTYEGDFIMNITKDINKEYFINDESIIYIYDTRSGLRAFVDELQEKVDVLGNHYFQAYLSSFDGGLYDQKDMDLKVQIDDIIYNTEVIRAINGVTVTDPGIAFSVGDSIYIDTDLSNGNSDFIAKITSTTNGRIEEIQIDNIGDNYVVGDFIDIEHKKLTNGYGFSAIVNNVDDTTGSVLSVKMYNGGFDYGDEQNAIVITNSSGIEPTTPASFTLKGDSLGSIKRYSIQNGGIIYDENSIVLKTTGGRDEILTPEFSNIFDTPKITINQKGFTSHNNVLTDSWYYQQFSYLVSSYEQPNQWKHVVKSLLHPAGLVQFNKWIYESESLEDDIIGFTGGETIVTKIFLILAEVAERFLIGVENEYDVTHYVYPIEFNMVGHHLRDLDSEKFLVNFNWPISIWADENIDSILGDRSIELNYINESYIEQTPSDFYMAQGHYNMNGNQVGLRKSTIMPLDQGNYVMTGNDALIHTQNTDMVLDQGNYAMTGNDVLFNQNFSIPINQGSYIMMGTDTALTFNRPLPIDQGSFSMIGNDTTFVKGSSIPLDSGLYIMTGKEMTMINYQIIMDDGSYSMIGKDTTFVRNYPLTIDQGTFTMTGNDVTLTTP